MLVAEMAYLDLVHTLALPRPTCKEACLVIGSVKQPGLLVRTAPMTRKWTTSNTFPPAR